MLRPAARDSHLAARRACLAGHSASSLSPHRRARRARSGRRTGDLRGRRELLVTRTPPSSSRLRARSSRGISAIAFLGPARRSSSPRVSSRGHLGSSSATAGAPAHQPRGSGDADAGWPRGLPGRSTPRRVTAVVFVVALALTATLIDGAELRELVQPLFAILDGHPCEPPAGDSELSLRGRPEHRAGRRADRRDLRAVGLRGARASCWSTSLVVHLHDAARRDRPRAHAGVREPLVGRAVGPDPHARRARLPRRRATAPRSPRSRATSPRTPGMSKRDQELAHTAGLLHDIGKFALSDRVMERGVRADRGRLARDPPPSRASAPTCCATSASTGRSSEIVVAHHERVDGSGYPAGLTGDEIPEIAKIVAVAEVYDTLTAPDTYRTPMTSFEALTELRRVVGLAAGRALRRGAGRAARGPGHGVPPRRRGRLRRRSSPSSAA